MSDQDSENERRVRVEELMHSVLNTLMLPRVSVDDVQHVIANVVAFIALRTDQPQIFVDSTVACIRDVYNLQPTQARGVDPSTVS